MALLFHDCGTRRGWVVSSTLRPHFTPWKDRYPFYRRLGGPQGRSRPEENLVPTGIRSRTVQSIVSHYTDWATRPTLIRGYVVQNTTVCLVRYYILNIKKKLRVSASSSHHQVFSQNVKIVLYNSRDSVLKKRSRHQTPVGTYHYTGSVGVTLTLILLTWRVWWAPNNASR